MRKLLLAVAAAVVLTVPMTGIVKAEDNVTVKEHPNGGVTIKEHDNDQMKLREHRDDDDVTVRDRDRAPRRDNEKVIIKDR